LPVVANSASRVGFGDQRQRITSHGLALFSLYSYGSRLSVRPGIPMPRSIARVGALHR
jgi:hypothetical protein